MIGLEVESVDDRGAALARFIVAEVVAAEPHPNADKLRVCVVDTGGERLQVVCGAPNARAGMKGVFAPVGAYHPRHRHHPEGRRRSAASRAHGMLLLRARDGLVATSMPASSSCRPMRRSAAPPRRRWASTIR